MILHPSHRTLAASLAVLALLGVMASSPARAQQAPAPGYPPPTPSAPPTWLPAARAPSWLPAT